MKTKIVYVVIGSEDGILGVYGNKKMAYKQAVLYVKSVANVAKDSEIISYSKVCRELKDVYNYSIDIVDDYSFYGNARIAAVPWNEVEL